MERLGILVPDPLDQLEETIGDTNTSTIGKMAYYDIPKSTSNTT